MHARAMLTAVALAATLLAGPSHGDECEDPDEPKTTPAEKAEAYRVYVENVEKALGVFNDIQIYSETPERWELLSGKYVPIYVNDEEADEFTHGMPSDRPMMLPTDFTGWEGGDGGSIPYSVVGRMPGSNPEVQWVFLHRHYKIKHPVKSKNVSGEPFDVVRDVAVIGHHPRTGATAFFQFYGPCNPKSAPKVVSPFGEEGRDFWRDVPWLAYIDCAQCHSADPFIHTPWIDQVRIDDGRGPGFHEPMVPSSPLGPYYIIGAEVQIGDEEKKNIFGAWDEHLRHLVDPGNACTSCHRIGASDTVGLYQNSTHGIGADDYESNRYQTRRYQSLPWMPPVNVLWSDFYKGQKSLDDEQALESYMERYGESVKAVNTLGESPKDRLAEIPRPPREHRSILVDREHRDEIAPNASLLIVDTRMRANTDGNLHEWRFLAEGSAGPGMRAAPAVLRRVSPGSLEFKLLFTGEPRGADSAGSWVPVAADGDYALRQGDYLGMVLTNKGTETGPALVPYSQDDWAVVTGPDGTTSFPFGVVTYRTDPPEPSKVFTLEQPAYRTYSFEFRNRL